MAGMNPDPAQTFDLLEYLENSLKPAVTEAVAEGVKRGTIVAAQSATEFQTVNFALTDGAQPVVLLGYDRARTRALVRATAPGVYVGTLQQLSGGFGYLVPTEAGDEIRTIGEVYVAYIPDGTPAQDVRITVWLERTVS